MPVYGTLPAAASNAKNYSAWSKDLVTWIYGNQVLNIYRSPSTGLCSTADEDEGGLPRYASASRRTRSATPPSNSCD